MHATNFVNYYLRLTLSTLHFGYQSLSPPLKVNLPVKPTAVEWKVPGRLMRCVVPLFHAIPLFIPLLVCAGCGCMCVGVRVGWPDGVTCRGKQAEETAGWCSSHSALYTSDRELVFPCSDTFPRLVFSQ